MRRVIVHESRADELVSRLADVYGRLTVGDPFAEEMLGIDYIIHTEQMAAHEIKEALLVPGAINVDSFAGDTIEVAEVILADGSEAVGHALKEVRLPDNSLVVSAAVRNRLTFDR